jgi:hypothetical protein
MDEIEFRVFREPFSLQRLDFSLLSGAPKKERIIPKYTQTRPG